MADIAIIGGGLAGCAAAYFLKKQGARPLIIERQQALAMGSSGNPYGLVMPQLSIGDSPAARFNHDAYLMAVDFYEGLGIEKHKAILQLAVNPDDALRFQKLSDKKLLPADHMQALDAQEADEISGLRAEKAALYFPKALTVSPAEICRTMAGAAQVILSAEVLQLERHGGKWRILDEENRLIAEVDGVVIANAMDALRFPMTAHLPLKARRGQLSFINDNEASRRLRCSITFGGYMTPSLNGMHVLGATYETPRDDASELTVPEHDKNLHKLSLVLPALFPDLEGRHVAKGRASVRTTTPDHLPVMGAVKDYEDLYVLTGLGSRGLTTAPFCAQQLAQQIIHKMPDENTALGLYRFIKNPGPPKAA